MGRVYPEFDHFFITEATGAPKGLTAEVWRHEALAQRRGLPLVVEVYATSVLGSRRLTEWWLSCDRLAQDTLSGIYLLRVDLKKFGPEPILRLTPYAVAGAPLFVGWNPVGQVLSRSQFDELTPEAMSLPLSAFIEDVLGGRPHSLNPHPSLGSAERNREAEALRHARSAFEKAKGHLPTGPIPAAASVNSGPVANGIPSEGVESPPSEGVESPPSQATPAGEGVLSATIKLERLLSAARAQFGTLEDEVGCALRFSLDDLKPVDAFLDGLTEDARVQFARQFGAVLAVYLGDTIRYQIHADWNLDEQALSASGTLMLQGEVLGQHKRSRPIEWVVETLDDPTRSLFGQALSWCRIY